MMDNKTDSSNNALTINFTNNLRYLMQKTKITSVDLAEIAGVSAELIGKIKNGGLSNPSLKVLSGISKHFAVSLQDLIFSDLANIGENLQLKPISYIPVVDWNAIKTWKEEESVTSIVLENVSSVDKFALYLDHDYGVFPEHGFVFVDTKLKPKSNDYVLVLNKTNDGMQLFFRTIETGLNFV